MLHSGPELSRLLMEAEALVDESGAAVVVEQLLAETAEKSGRPRELPVRTLFVAQQLLAFEGDHFLVSVPKLLNHLDAATKRRLGIYRRTVTYRQVQHLFAVIAAVTYDATDESEAGYLQFDQLTNAIATRGAHAEAADTTSLALDASDIPSWGTSRYRFAYDEQGTYIGNELHVTDVDAHWRSKDNPEGKVSFFGYDLTVAVGVREENGPAVPLAVKAMRFRGATHKTMAMGLACVGDAAAKRGVLGDVLMDRGYTMSNDSKDFILPVRALGGEPIFALRDNQVGSPGTIRGAVIVDGRPYSPSMPKKLHRIKQVKHTETYQPNPDVVAEYEAAIKARSVYALVPHGARRPNGAQVYMCPAAAGKLRCPLVASSALLALGTMPAANPPAKARPDTVCSSKFRTFTAEELPLSQRHIFGSTAWRKSYSRRGEVERHFARTKDHSQENIRRGSIRVMGLAKVGLLISFSLASINRRLAASFERNRNKKPVVKRGRRPGNTVKKFVVVVTAAQGTAAPMPLRV